ncbi:hypothetical protein U1769_19295 [Sphingomonas sp. ZT3P38]|uniref:hypothetical protein n=1 Tax=Parasphingomonas zepuensis TaxID=3096161 RepID=UPI002FCB905F
MNEQQYEIISARRSSYDSFLWQTPGLAMAAQAFLIAASFDDKTTQLNSITLGSFSLFVGFASLQLLMKHRHCEVEDSERLAKFERDNEAKGFSVAHGRSVPCTHEKNFVTQFSAYKVWRAVLIGFCGLSVFSIGSGVVTKSGAQQAAPASPPQHEKVAK